MTTPNSNKNYFEMYELTCNCGCGRYNIDAGLIILLNAARHLAGIPFRIVSGCRCLTFNKFVGGVPSSAHVPGHAVDIKITTSRERYLILSALLAVGFRRIGIGKTFIHADNSPTLPDMVSWMY